MNLGDMNCIDLLIFLFAREKQRFSAYWDTQMEPYVEIHAIVETSPVWFMSGWIVLGFASGHVIHGIQGSAGKKDAGTAYGF